MTRCLGIIGGLGVGATVHYYQELIKLHEGYLPLLMIHADMERVLRHAQAGEKMRLAEYLAELISQLREGGAAVAAVTAITPHLCIRELLQLSPLPVVNALESIGEEIRARKFHRVALFGTRFTVHSRLFDMLDGVEIVTPRPDEIEYIHETYFGLASSGRGSEAAHRGLTELARRLCERDGVEAIVLAGTDLSVIFNETNTNFPYIDCAQVHIRAILRAVSGDGGVRS
ncbi:MAG TPA: aspartate/glutamate racemase family protein [Bryobacteraceae bacterium]|nr:aspartate/glutamate racemase family protein [Bryobacteraceae bacterium]